jgi:hypothetical protein
VPHAKLLLKNARMSSAVTYHILVFILLKTQMFEGVFETLLLATMEDVPSTYALKINMKNTVMKSSSDVHTNFRSKKL